MSDLLWLPSENKINYHPTFKFNSNKFINFNCYTDDKLKNLLYGNFKPINIDNSIKISKKYINKIKTIEKNRNKKFIELKNKYKDLNDNELIIKINEIIGAQKFNARKLLLSEIDGLNKITKCKKIEIQLNHNQKTIIFKWFKECTKVYNKCVNKFNNNPKETTTDYKKLKLEIFDELYGKNSKGCPYAVLTDEVRSFCSNLKSCYTNLNNGHIKFFELKSKNTLHSQSILIPKKAINNNGIYVKVLENIFNFNNLIKDVEKFHDSRLVYDKRRNKFYIHIVHALMKQNIGYKLDKKFKKSVVSLDPGEVSFMAFYSMDHYGTIGDNLRNPILKYQTQIKQYQSALKRNKNKQGNKLKNRKKVKMKILDTYRHIKNLVKELHNQTALYLCKNYERIIIPVFETQQMVSNGPKKEDIRTFKEKTRKSRLNRRVKFTLNQLSHYSFRQHLIHKCNEYGCQIDVVNESYTSMCCTKCGYLSKNYIKRTKKCTYCGFEINRDINGARNILMKNHNHILNIKKPRLSAKG